MAEAESEAEEINQPYEEEEDTTTIINNRLKLSAFVIVFVGVIFFIAAFFEGTQRLASHEDISIATALAAIGAVFIIVAFVLAVTSLRPVHRPE